MPALSSAEKMRRYRVKMKTNVVKVMSVKQRDRERKMLKKALNTESQKKAERIKNKERVQRHREKLKTQHVASESEPPATPISHLTPSKAFGSKQALGKAKRRVQIRLPISPRKRVAVVMSLAYDIGVSGNNIGSHNPIQHGNALTGEKIETIKKYFIDTSWVCHATSNATKEHSTYVLSV